MRRCRRATVQTFSLPPSEYRIYATSGVLESANCSLVSAVVVRDWGCVMSVQGSDRPATVVPFAPNPKGQPDAAIIADDSGRSIVAMLQKAAEMAKEDCARAMDLAHKLSFQLRAAEERARDLEAEATHFRDRAARAEAWLLRIHNEVESTFFQKRERDPRQPQRQ